MCCIETYLARGRILLHPFFPCFVVSKRYRSKDLEDPCVPLESCLHFLRMLLCGIGGPIFQWHQAWTKYCAWDVFANHLEPLSSFGILFLVLPEHVCVVLERKTMQAVKTTPHIDKEKKATLVPSTVKLLYRQTKTYLKTYVHHITNTVPILFLNFM